MLTIEGGYRRNVLTWPTSSKRMQFIGMRCANLEHQIGFFETDKARRVKYYEINLIFEIGKGCGECFSSPHPPQLLSF